MMMLWLLFACDLRTYGELVSLASQVELAIHSIISERPLRGFRNLCRDLLYAT